MSLAMEITHIKYDSVFYNCSIENVEDQLPVNLRAILIAVLERSIRDLKHGVGLKVCHEVRLKHNKVIADSITWFCDDSFEPYSFLYVCEHLGLCPVHVCKQLVFRGLLPAHVSEADLIRYSEIAFEYQRGRKAAKATEQCLIKVDFEARKRLN